MNAESPAGVVPMRAAGPDQPDQYVSTDPVVNIGRAQIEALKALAARTGRLHLDTHRSPAEKLHERFTVYLGSARLAPSRYPDRDRSVHVVEGHGDLLLLDDGGAVVDHIAVGDARSDRELYCRIPAGVWHAWTNRTECLVLHEATSGPDAGAALEHAAWDAPPSNAPRGRTSTIERANAVTREVWIATDRIVTFGDRDGRYLSERIEGSLRNRVRLCAHKHSDEALQEMVIAFTRSSYIQPSRHLGKEESIHIMQGSGIFVVFDEHGAVRTTIPVGEFGSGRQFYCRTPEATYHTLLLTSDTMVVQETTQGPFTRADTEFAAWAPLEDNPAAVREYMDRLLAAVHTST